MKIEKAKRKKTLFEVMVKREMLKVYIVSKEASKIQNYVYGEEKLVRFCTE